MFAWLRAVAGDWTGYFPTDAYYDKHRGMAIMDRDGASGERFFGQLRMDRIPATIVPEPRKAETLQTITSPARACPLPGGETRRTRCGAFGGLVV